MKLSDSQWMEVFCLIMEVDGQSAESIATIRAASKSKGAISDLRGDIQHALLSARYYPAPIRSMLEELLRSKGFPPLSKLDTGLLAACRRILKRGRIRGVEEFRIVGEALSDIDFDITQSDRIKLSAMSSKFEARRKK